MKDLFKGSWTLVNWLLLGIIGLILVANNINICTWSFWIIAFCIGCYGANKRYMGYKEK